MPLTDSITNAIMHRWKTKQYLTICSWQLEMYSLDMTVSTYRWSPTKNTYIQICNCSGNEKKRIYSAMPRYIVLKLINYGNHIL